MSTPSIRLVAASALVATSLVHAADPVRLNKEETQQAISGKSMTYETRGSSSGALTIYFSADGRMTMKLANNPRVGSGTWSIDDNGRYCLKVISGTFSDGCRYLFKTDTGYALKTGSGDIITIDKLE